MTNANGKGFSFDFRSQNNIITNNVADNNGDYGFHFDINLLNDGWLDSDGPGSTGHTFTGNTASGNGIADIKGISMGPSPSTTPPSAIGSPTSITGFEFPNGVAVDNFGNIYVADTRTDTVKKFNPSKELLFEISGFNELFDVGVDNSGYIYTLDQGSNTVKNMIHQDLS